MLKNGGSFFYNNGKEDIDWEVVDIYAFYVDIFWLNNTLMNGAILLIVREILRENLSSGIGSKKARACFQGAKLWRLAVAAGLGGVMEVLLLLFAGSYVTYLALSHLLVIPFMVFAAFGKSAWGKFLKRTLFCYGIAVGLGGFLSALENTFGWRQIPVLGGVVAVFLTLNGCRFFRASLRKQRYLYGVELENRGNTVRCKGLWDSGNQLREPYGSRPVHILSDGVAEGLQLEESDRLGFIPYAALGKNDGVLPIYRLEKLRILRGEPPLCFRDAVVAKAQPGLLEKGDFQVILHGDIMQK